MSGIVAITGRSMQRAPSLKKLTKINQVFCKMPGNSKLSNNILTTSKLRVASQLTYLFLTTAAKLSVLLLYRRIFTLKIRWFRIAWWVNTIVAILNGVVLLIIGLTTCAPHPPSYEWQHVGSCRENPRSIAPMGFINATTDLMILLLPTQICWSLQLSRKRKVGVLLVLGLGLMYDSFTLPSFTAPKLIGDLSAR